MEFTPQRLSDEYFKHEPLDHRYPSIRLVRILPSLSAEGLIQCNISPSTIAASYQCLSYRWGDETSGHHILLNGKPFKVRQNLLDFLALKRSRVAASPDTTELIWIDALCIDQTSVGERNHQVAQMGCIFRGATVVNVWLGRCPQLLAMFDGHWKDLSRIAQRARDAYVYPDQINGRASPLLSHMYDVYKSPSYFDTHKTNPARWELEVKQQVIEDEFFNNEYWTRAWITQEIFVAEHAVVLLENEEFSIQTCIKVLMNCDKHLIHGNPVVKRFALFLGFSDQGQPLIQPGGLARSNSFLILYRQFRDKNCAIPRDRIYSLLSLYGNGDKIEVDYAQPDDELLCQVVNSSEERVGMGLCSIVSLVRSLMPQSGPLGNGFIEFGISGLALEWGPIEAAAQGDQSYVYRKLLAIKVSELEWTRPELCVYWQEILDTLRGRATLVEHAATDMQKPDFTQFGQEILSLTRPVREENLMNILQPSGRFNDPSILRLYGEDFSIKVVSNHGNFWTLRLSLSLLWTMLERSQSTELCENNYRFSCRSARLGCGPWNVTRHPM